MNVLWWSFAGGPSPRLHYGATLGGHALPVSMQASFLYQVAPNKRHILAAATSSGSVTLASSMLGYPFQRQPDKQDRLLGSVPHGLGVWYVR